MSEFVALNLFFGTLFAAGARILLGRRGSPLLWAYVLVTIAFVYLLPEQEYSTDVSFDVLLLSHLSMLCFFMIVLLVARNAAVSNAIVRNRAAAVSLPTVLFVSAAWLAIRAYLAVAYGPAALSFSRSVLAQTDGLVAFSAWEAALASITTTLLLGTIGAATITLAAKQAKRPVLLAGWALGMLAFVVVTNESPIGSRRLLLALGALWLSVSWTNVVAPSAAWVWIRHELGRVLLVVLAIGALSLWYQRVRYNDVKEILAAKTAGELFSATVKFATMLDRDPGPEESSFLRSGPLDYFAKVVFVSVVGGRSSEGEATIFSLVQAVPKALYPGEKPTGDVDDVLLEYIGILPLKPTQYIDYPTSIASIAVADFGILAVVPAALLIGMCFWFVGMGLALRAHGQPLMVPLFLGLGIFMIGSQEAGLTAIVANFRDVGIAAVSLLGVMALSALKDTIINQAIGVKRSAPISGQERLSRLTK